MVFQAGILALYCTPMFLVKPKDFGPSQSHELNLLWQKDRFYLMDNHRAAIWCWFQSIKASESYTYLHIDAHYDDLAGAVKDFKECQIHIKDISLDHFLKLTTSVGKQSLLRWDNYHPVLFECYADNIEKAYFCTHHLGNHSSRDFVTQWEAALLLRNLENLEVDSTRFIINLDIDFLTSVSDPKMVMFSEQYIERLAQIIHAHYEKGAIVTVALSPECSGGWEMSLNIFNKYFNFVNFEL